jgi:hypothetical protein
MVAAHAFQQRQLQRCFDTFSGDRQIERSAQCGHALHDRRVLAVVAQSIYERLAHTPRFVSAARDTSVQPARTGAGRLGKYDPLDAHCDDHGRPLMSWQRR